ncbi:MAG TPA: glycosyltransferase family 39 protein [Acidimicrobiia bacterium]|nr:glycosyltransferase family 39 protein [Acidimicrobiia bacterium]
MDTVRNAPARAPARSGRAVWATVGAIMVLSLGVHLWGFMRDLPTPDVDERYFVTPAAYMAASGDANPHWFGHPGSTVISPLALIFRLREVVFHGAPVTGAAPSIAARFAHDPSSFYVIGRLWAMLFSIAALPLLFVIGRRLFGTRVGLLATALWAVVPLAVQYGRITRTDSVALFLVLLALWACIRALERPTRGWFVTTGAIAGLGVATRYFLASLAVVIVATWWFARREERVAPSVLTASLLAFAATFVLTTPYLFLDWHDAITSITAEAGTRVPFQSHGFLDNLAYYALDAIPGAISWLGLGIALVGIVVALRRRSPATTLLLVWLACVVVEISVLGVHWSRWVIPALPVLVLFATFGVVSVGRAAARRLGPANVARPRLAALLAGVAVLAIGAGPAVATVSLDQTDAQSSTRATARNWMVRHLAPGSRVAVEIRGPDLFGTGFDYVEHYRLPAAGTVADYARAGYRYLVVNAGLAHQYQRHPARDPSADAFYDYLRDDTTRLAEFTNRDRTGPHLLVYDLGPGMPRERETSVDARLEARTLRAGPVDTVDDRSGAVPQAQRRVEHVGRHAWPD